MDDLRTINEDRTPEAQRMRATPSKLNVISLISKISHHLEIFHRQLNLQQKT